MIGKKRSIKDVDEFLNYTGVLGALITKDSLEDLLLNQEYCDMLFDAKNFVEIMCVGIQYVNEVEKMQFKQNELDLFIRLASSQVFEDEFNGRMRVNTLEKYKM